MRPGVLPNSKISILNGQLRKLSRLTLDETAVQCFELARQYAHGPIVGNDVMHGQQENMLDSIHAKQDGAHEWALGQIERALRFALEQVVKFSLAQRRLQVKQVHY